MIFLITFCHCIVSSDAASRVKAEAPHFAAGDGHKNLQQSATMSLDGKLRKDLPVGENNALGTVRPMSTTLWCIINITVQYLLVYTILAFIHLYQDWSEEDWPIMVRTFRNAAHTVTYGPAFCVLLLGCRMRVNWLTQGHGSAPFSVQVCMYVCTLAITLNTLFVVIFPIFVREGLSVCDKTGDPHPKVGVDHRGLNIFLQVVRYLFLLVLYGGVA